MPDKKNVAIESYSEIRNFYKLLKLKQHADRNRLCYSQNPDLKSITMECWCRKAGENGKDLPCPQSNYDYGC